MTRILYVFPHPDDESFGPGPVLARQRREGHEVHLLTLTRGEATSQREKLGLTKDEMGAVRYREMQCVADVLELTELTVLDFPDGDLAGVETAAETAVAACIQRVRPEVVVTYAEHGISGHPDHVVGHRIVKRAVTALRDGGADYLKRLAFFTIPEDVDGSRPAHLRGSPADEIDCVVAFEPEDRRKGEAALACHESYREVVEAQQPLETVADGVCFELYEERPTVRLDDLTKALPR